MREKVTVEEMMSLIYEYGNRNAELYAASRANCCSPHDDAVKLWIGNRDLARERIKQKLECLVSLQDKKC